MRVCGLEVQRSIIYPGLFLGGSDISIGYDSVINYECFFDAGGRIVVGDSCSLGMQVLLCTSTHVIGDDSKRAGRNDARPIILHDGCWIGARSTILPGVVIGAGAVVAAGSVVASDCAPNSLYAGNPAKMIRRLTGSRAEC